MHLNIHPECIEEMFLTFEITYTRNENLGTNKSVKHVNKKIIFFFFPSWRYVIN